MKKVRRYNITLLVLMGLCGILLGASVVFFVLSFFDARSFLVLAGFICAILLAGLTLSLPFVSHERDNQIHRVEKMFKEFGKEVSFLDEKVFLKALSARKNVKRIYALHMELGSQIGDMKRREIGYALADAIEEFVIEDSLVGYDEYGNFLFCPAIRERDLLKALKNVEKKLLSDSSLPTFALLLGASKSEEDYPKMIDEACAAASFAAETRSSLDLVVYEENKESEGTLDLYKEEEQGRLSYYVLPFEKEEEERIEVLSPNLYDSFRGDLYGKDLFHALSLSKATAQLDEVAMKRAIRYLVDNPDSGALFVRLCKESAQNPTFLSEIATKLEEKKVDKNRLVFAFSSLETGDRYVKGALKRARALGFRVGVYDYGGEGIDPLVVNDAAYAMMKPELLRASADLEYLTTLVNALRSIGVKPLIEKGSLGEELSAMPSLERIRLEDVLDEEEEKKEEDK